MCPVIVIRHKFIKRSYLCRPQAETTSSGFAEAILHCWHRQAKGMHHFFDVTWLFYCSWKVTCLFRLSTPSQGASDFLKCGQQPLRSSPASRRFADSHFRRPAIDIMTHVTNKKSFRPTKKFGAPKTSWEHFRMSVFRRISRLVRNCRTCLTALQFLC